MNETDLVRLRHMMSYAHEVSTFIENESRDSLDNDLKLLRAVSMSIGIIGEAATHVSREVQDANPQIPWSDIIGMRVFLFHIYHRIDPDIVWATAPQFVPDLISRLEALLPPLENEN